MKHYSGRKFERMAAKRGLTLMMQTAMDNVTAPPIEAIDGAIARGAEGVIRKSFFHIDDLETNTQLFVHIDVIFTRDNRSIHEVVEYDNENQYNFYRRLASVEARGSIQSN